MGETVATEYGTRAFWKSVVAQQGDGSDRDLLAVGHGAAGPIRCTRQYAEHRLATCRAGTPA